jgi:hypothetical protein
VRQNAYDILQTILLVRQNAMRQNACDKSRRGHFNSFFNKNV